MHPDWDAGHGPITGPLSAATGALAAADLGRVAHLTPGWAALAAGAGLLGSHISGSRRRYTRATLGLRAAAWTAVGGWCSWAMATGVWAPERLAALGAGALLFGCGLAGAHHAEDKAEHARQAAADAEQRALARAGRGAIAKEWEERVARVCTVQGLRIVNVEQWDTGGGYSLDSELPAGGTTWKHLATFADGLAADARLPEGCGVEVGPGAHRGAVLFHVATVNRLVDDAPYPDDYSPTSINDFSSVGACRDGALAGAVMRQLTGLTVGQKGSGKTNFMHVRIANQTRMVDNLAWVIDLNGGGLALPWLHAWHSAGRPGKPPIDWVADTPDKALAMAKAGLRIAKARKPGYKAREIAANDDKLPIDAEVPAITFNNDEVAELFSPKARRDPVLRELGDTIVQIVELARAVAVNVDDSALRATQDVLSEPQLLKQAGFRVGMRVTDQAELNYLFGWDAKVTPEDAPYPGCGFIKVGNDPVRPFKAYRITPQQIADIVKATADLHPDLDELSRKAAGEDYERRWENTDHLFGLGEPPAPAEPEPAVHEAPDAQQRRRVTADWDVRPPATATQAAIDQADAARRKLHEAMAEVDGHDGDLERRFQEVIEGGGGLWNPPAGTAPQGPAGPQCTPGVTKDTRWPLVFAIVAGSGPQGINPDAICDLFAQAHRDMPAPSRSAVTEWLKKEPKIYQPTGRTNYAIRPSVN